MPNDDTAPNRYIWEENSGVTGRYRDRVTGLYVKGSTVRRELDAYLDKKNEPAVALSIALQEGKISVADWQTGMMDITKKVHVNAVAVSVGGAENMTPTDRGRAGGFIKAQYTYLRNFALDIESGKQRLDGTFMNRTKQYVQAGRRTMYAAKEEALKASPVTHVGSLRHVRDSCTQCIELDKKWYAWGDATYEHPGDRICRKNCRCSERYGVANAKGQIIEVESL